MSSRTFCEEMLEDSDDELLMEMMNAIPEKRNTRERPVHFTNWTEEEFFMRFRLRKSSVLKLLEMVEEKLEHATDRNKSLSPMEQLLLALRFFATGSFLTSAADFCGVHKSTASRTVRRVSEAIASLRSIYVQIPRTEEERRKVERDFYGIARFPKVIGAIDCTHIKISSPGGNEAETFRNRKGNFSLNVQTICNANLEIMNVVARWPGSTHDQTIFNNSNVKGQFEREDMGGRVILGDSGYKSERYMMTPIRNLVLREENLYNESQIRTRNAVERSYGVWKRRFPVLSLGIRLSLDTSMAVIVACAVLHNYSIREKEGEPPNDLDVGDLNLEEDQVMILEGLDHGREFRSPFLVYFRNLK